MDTGKKKKEEEEKSFEEHSCWQRRKISLYGSI